MPHGSCVVDGCTRPGHRNLKYCSMHEARLRIRGSLGGPGPERALGISVQERMTANLRLEDNGCIVWTGRTDPNGYGRVYTSGCKSALAHRLAWTEAHGPIPTETPHVLHHCDNPPCCIVEHLFLGTQADNMADMASMGRRVRCHCKRGHPLVPSNLYVYGRRRSCRECLLMNSRARYWREKAS